MTEFLFEILFQFVFEFLAQALFELGFRAAATALRAKVVRFGLAVVAGFGFGWWWGTRLADDGLDGRPRLFYVTLAVAVLAMVAAFDRMARGRTEAAGPDRVLSPPWRWDASRLAAFALLNVAVAAGIDIGYSPVPG